MKVLSVAALTLVASLAFADSTPRAPVTPGKMVASLRRLTESQYRNSIADIFGPDIAINGRFEPILRPVHELIATGANDAAVSPAGLEQFDAMARGIAAQVFDDAHRAAFMDCAPKRLPQPDDACARATLLPLGRYLFRRPLTAVESELYIRTAADAATGTGSFYGGLQLALAAMLVSPDFLYVVESAEPDPAKSGFLRLDNYARAARLSFVLWNTTPNDALLKAAEAGRLTNEQTLRTMATRMVASPRLEDGVSAFFSDMLVYEKFEDLSKDPIIYPRFNLLVAKDLAEQLRLLILDTVLTRNQDYRELFTTRHTFLTRGLGAFYGARVDAPTGWMPYEFPLDSNRAGILSQAGFVALYSHPGRSSATVRGRAVRELLMCQPVPDPPGNVDFKVVQDVTNPVLRTARSRLLAHSSASPVCAGCHKITDPIGLTLEGFDGSGAFRKQENGVDIDTTGALYGKNFDGAVGLGAQLAATPATTECVAQRAIEFATGRSVKKADAEQIHKQFAAAGYRIKALFQQIATAPGLYAVPAAKVQPQQAAMVTTNSGASQ
jgi:hypothetical protein